MSVESNANMKEDGAVEVLTLRQSNAGVRNFFDEFEVKFPKRDSSGQINRSLPMYDLITFLESVVNPAAVFDNIQRNTLPDEVEKSTTAAASTKMVTTSEQNELEYAIQDIRGARFKFPVSLEIFRRHINYDELIRPILMKAAQDESKASAMLNCPKQCDWQFLRFYRSFYVYPDRRQQYNYHFKTDNAVLKERLLSLAEPLNEKALKLFSSNQIVEPQKTLTDADLNPYSIQEAPLPVSYKAFSRHILNLPDIVDKMLCSKEYNGMSREECAQTFYRAFYTDSKIRNKYNIKLKPCPSKVRGNLLAMFSNVEQLKSPEGIALKSKTKLNVVNFVPKNYITRKLKCPQKSLELEQYFLSTFDKREELKNAEDQFFADNSVEHTIQYLLHNTHGRAMYIWHILSKLSIEEFRAHTGIYNAQEFYENNNILTLCYKHVIENGCWPLNLYVKMETFRQLLQTKGIEMPLYEFEHISPKILHWSELQLYTNFDEIVASNYSYQTSKVIKDSVSLLNEKEKLYSQCWLHNQWIHQVPKITENVMMVAASHVPAAPPLCSPTLMKSDPSLHVVDSAPTVDKAATTAVHNIQNESPRPVAKLIAQLIKQEPIKCLDKLRFDLNNSKGEAFNGSAADQCVALAIQLPKGPLFTRPALARTSGRKRKLALDNVPQPKHEFRPLPLNEICRIETLSEGSNPAPSPPNEQSQQPPLQPTITVSQVLATDNSIFDSTQIRVALGEQMDPSRKKNT
ncbi:protein telomere ends associated-like [Scaptodrosophila lebanonensis]|uniref:Protein telomere ends associated-like n=1 Tax=Drosophila lebanonensis TaxID=7225 RepID=A0A6J2U5R1_DROLE|nr:protein telomere ends associated-like [Scaptodrosophila lebanonensis]